jgi:hypothetical protein
VNRLGPLREREFRLLFAGRSISMLGNAVAPLGLAFAVVRTLHDSATDLGIVLTVRQVPVIALLLFGGVLGDRLPRNVVMVATNLVSGASQALAAALLLTGHARLWELAALAAVNGASSAFFMPASSGVIPLTVSSELLQQANATLRLSVNATQIGGAAIGALIVGVANPGTALAVDAGSYVLSAFALGAMRLPPLAPPTGNGVLRDLRIGWSDFWSRGWLWSIVVQFGFVNACTGGIVQVLGPAIAQRDLGGGAAWGGVLTAQSVGFVLMGLLMLRWRPRRILRTATFSVFPIALPVLALARPAPLGVIVACAFVAGASIEIFGVLWDLTMQQEIPAERLSRLYSYDALGSWALMPLAYAAVGPIGAAVGDRATCIGGAVLIVVATALVLLSRDVRTLERRS